jgi:hypothetical protein
MWGRAVCRQAMPDGMDAAASIEHGLQRVAHTFSEEGENVDKVALPSAVPAHQQQWVIELNTFVINAAEVTHVDHF